MAWTVAGYAPGLQPPAATWAPGGWGGGPGGPTQGGPAGLGYNPQVPLPTETLPGTTSGNMAALGGLYGLAGGVNQFNIGQAQQPLVQGLPDYTKMVGQSSANIGSMLRGEVPSDVVTQILQQSAERGIMTGSPGSPNANSAMLRALGLTSLGLQQTGEGELTAAIGRTPKPNLFDPASMFVTPQQQQEAAVANRLYGAAPNPEAVARANLASAQTGLGRGLGSVSPVGIGAPPAWNQGAIPGGMPAGPTTMNYGGIPMDQPPGPGGFNWQQWASTLGGPTATPAAPGAPANAMDLGANFGVNSLFPDLSLNPDLSGYGTTQEAGMGIPSGYGDMLEPIPGG